MAVLDHILVVDDDPDVSRLVGKVLDGNGYRTTLVADIRSFREVMSRRGVDLIILDLTFPDGEDGLVACRNLRADSDVPVIILSSKGDEMDRIIGLEMGADDYLPKPFNPRELLARVRSVLRRSRLSPKGERGDDSRAVYHFAGWKLDNTVRKLYSPEGGAVPLSGSEFGLLTVFLRYANRVLSREQLLELTYGRSGAPFDRTIDMQVSRLRRRLRDDPRNPGLIKTVRSAGYLFSLKVERHYGDGGPSRDQFPVASG